MFTDAGELSFFTYLENKKRYIYSVDFKEKEKISPDEGIYTILDKKNIDGDLYWEIKKIDEVPILGWISADSSIKFLNVQTEMVKINYSQVDNVINNKLSIGNQLKDDVIYSVSYACLYDGQIYYGISKADKFYGFVNATALDLGEIEPIKFSFNDKISKIYHDPLLKYGYDLHHSNIELECKYVLNSNNRIACGFKQGDTVFWTDIRETDICHRSIAPTQDSESYMNVEDYLLNTVKVDSDEYYTVVPKIGTNNKINEIVSSFHETNTDTSLYQKFDITIGIICDEFMYNALKNSANIEYIPFTEEISINEEYDMVLIVSSWRGIDESWQYMANPNGNKRKVLNTLLDEYNKAGIPTVFYSKEDPVNYERFISIAQKCKYIFTSASEMIDQYIHDTDNENVDYLEFSINPLYHNPIGKNLKDSVNQDQVIFAGSWMKKYPVRNKESAELFDGVIESKHDLNIIDRNFARQLYAYQYPIKYLPYVSETLTHDKLMKLHKATSWGLNLNSVKYSNTMFANRVYELQAMGNIVISNYSMGVNNKFPNVHIVSDKNDVKQILNHSNLNDNSDLIAKSVSNVMLNHTAYHRIEKIIRTIGWTSHHLHEPKILVIGESEKSRESYSNQLWVNKEFICLDDYNRNLNDERFDYIAYMKDEFIYEEYYLMNLISSFAYSDASITEMRGHEYTYTNITDYNRYKSLIKVDLSNNKILNIPETEILSEIPKLDGNKEKVLSVIIPIHNNGKYLEDKCFRSLKRSSIFNKMEIIMIDDGSSDRETLKIINRILRRHPDIKFYRFSEGSGSASRPRNKGIEMVKTKYLTFLDPDNEASGDGYRELLDELERNNDLDLVLGNVMKEDNTKKALLNYHYYVLTNNDDKAIVEDPKDFLIKANLRAHSIQALIVKSDIVKNNSLKMVEGAAGQDTMFFQDLLLHCYKFKSIPKLIHMYYAAVEGSVTTTIKLSFFEKYLKLEKERVPFLKKHGLYNIYVNQRLPYYFNNWYIKRLPKVEESDFEKAKEILLIIFNMYKESYNGEDAQFNKNLIDIFGIEVCSDKKKVNI
ncbi:glycosyltransferase [Salinicoccus halodurans]|nr:glycosyltransferase [Salinicoccus halodurans]